MASVLAAVLNGAAQQPAWRLIFLDTDAAPETSVSRQEYAQRTALKLGFGCGNVVLTVFGPRVGLRPPTEWGLQGAPGGSCLPARPPTLQQLLPGFSGISGISSGISSCTAPRAAPGAKVGLSCRPPCLAAEFGTSVLWPSLKPPGG